MLKKPNNPGLKKLPTKVRNKMGYAKSGGKVSSVKTVNAPKGFHWMKKGKEFKLMKNPSTGYKPHKGATLKASFPIQKVHKG